jgi:hypothetical protein
MSQHIEGKSLIPFLISALSAVARCPPEADIFKSGFPHRTSAGSRTWRGWAKIIVLILSSIGQVVNIQPLVIE